MSDISVVAAVLLLCLAANLSPGPNFALISRMAASGRKTQAWGAALGMAAAGTFYGILAMTGLSLLLQDVAWLSRAVQILGGLYLLWLGVSAWRDSTKISSINVECDTQETRKQRTFGAGLRTGTLVDLANPKNIAFYVSLFALAVPPDTAVWAKVSILVGAFIIEWLWYATVIQLLSMRKAQDIYLAFTKWIERAVGSILLLFGAKMIADK